MKNCLTRQARKWVFHGKPSFSGLERALGLIFGTYFPPSRCYMLTKLQLSSSNQSREKREQVKVDFWLVRREKSVTAKVVQIWPRLFSNVRLGRREIGAKNEGNRPSRSLVASILPKKTWNLVAKPGSWVFGPNRAVSYPEVRSSFSTVLGLSPIKLSFHQLLCLSHPLI